MGKISYKNRKLRILSALIASIYMVFHGIPIDLVRAFSSPGFYLAIGVSFAISLLLVHIIHITTVWLDGRCGWREHPFERAAMQFVFAVVIPALGDLLLISIYFQALDESIVDNGFLLIDYPVIVCLIIFFNLYYLIHYLLLTERALPKNISDLESGGDNMHKTNITSSDSATLSIHYNGQHVYFNVDNDILYFHREGKRVKAMTVHGNQYPINSSIADLEKRFAYDGLCRINRATIVNYKMVKGYLAGTKRDTAQLIIRPAFLPFIEDPQGEAFHVTKEFLFSFKSGLEEG